MMFMPKTQRASNFSTVPETPNLWNIHLVILKNKYKYFIIDCGTRSSFSPEGVEISFLPTLAGENAFPSRNESIPSYSCNLLNPLKLLYIIDRGNEKTRR